MNLLEVQGLRKTYPAFRLEDVSFSVPEGAVMGLIGRNGAGKSTTLKSILGLVHPDAGRVEMFGREFSENERYIKENIGVVLGGIDFYPKKKVRTITDVTRRFYSNWQEEKYRHYLDLFAIDENKRVDQLSSGMRVKYLLALALSHNARAAHPRRADERARPREPRRAGGAAAAHRGGRGRAASSSPRTSPRIWRSARATSPSFRRAACSAATRSRASWRTTPTLAQRSRRSLSPQRGGPMMRTLLYKQLRLVCHPMTPVFCMFGVMLMIPNYPLTVVWFYVMLGLFFTFLNMREQKDIYYSAILPIRKRDTVKAACLFTALIEIASLVIAVPFAVWRAHTSIGGNLVGVDANVTLFGFALMLYALFNAILLCSFYKTAYQVGTAFLKAIIPTSLLMLAMEISVHIPALAWLDGYDTARQLPC